MPSQPIERTSRLGALSIRSLGLVGQVATSWGVAGGLAAAMVVLLHVLAGSVSSSVTFVTATAFYVVGSLIAFLHGALLAYAGRPPDVTRQLALRRLGLAMLYDVPAAVLGWMVAMLMTMSVISLTAGRFISLLFASAGWVAAAIIFWWAWVETRQAVHHLLRRWPDARAFALVLGLGFLAVAPVFLVTRPEIWLVGARPTATAAAFMALAAILWIGGPLVVLSLLARSAWVRRHPSTGASEATRVTK